MNIKNYISLLFFVLLVHACAKKNDVQLPVDTLNHKIVFTITTDDAVVSRSLATRADNHYWGDNHDDEVGNDYETILGINYDTRINDETVRVLVFDGATGAFVGSVKNLVYFALDNSDSPDPSEFRFIGDISGLALQVDKSYKFMIIVNSYIDDSLLVNGGINDVLNSLIFNIADIKYPDGFIPMWGVTTYTVQKDKVHNLENIHLLRSAAKIVVSLSPEMAVDFELQNVFISQHSQKGYTCPKSWASMPTTAELAHWGDSFRVPDNAQTNTFYSFYKQDPFTWFVYLPEFRNSSDVTISVNVVKKDTGEPFIFDGDRGIKLKSYKNGFPSDEVYDIVRNHYYQYNITNVNVEQHGTLELTCTVAPWQLVEESWDYTDQVSVSDDGKIRWSDYLAFLEETGEVTLYPGRDLKCNFSILSPVGAQWRAEFIPVSGLMNAFKFTMPDTDNMQKSADSTVVVGNIVNNEGHVLFHELTIAPRVTQISENNFAYLRFSVITQDGRTIHVRELSNSLNYSDYTIIQSN